MERESNPLPMCRSGCGFYGNPATDGLCSVCYKDLLKKKQQPPVNSTPVSVSSSSVTGTTNASSTNVGTVVVTSQNFTTSVQVTNNTTNTAQPTVQSLLHNTEINKEKFTSDDDSFGSGGPSTSNDDEEKDGDKDSKKKKNRCATCRKKVGLTGFECRCGGLFCAIHRYSDKHDCTFDYREHGAAEIRRNNPVVVGEKIQKI